MRSSGAIKLLARPARSNIYPSCWPRTLSLPPLSSTRKLRHCNTVFGPVHYFCIFAAIYLQQEQEQEAECK